jgi:hypothetical protein
MNISRIALLSVLFTAPFAMASEAPVVQVAPVATPGFISQVTNLATAPFVFAKDYTFSATDVIVNWAVNPLFLNQLKKISYLQGGSFQKYVDNNYLGRVMVLAAAAVAAYKAYEAYNTQDVDADEDIFGDEEYADNN